MSAAVGAGKHQYELEMNGPNVCGGGIVEMKNDAMKNYAKYERAAQSMCVIMYGVKVIPQKAEVPQAVAGK